MDAAIHSFSGWKSEAAQAEPNAATIAAIAEATAKRDRFDNLRQDPDDIIALPRQSYRHQKFALEAPIFAAPLKPYQEINKQGVSRITL
jgi:hypothetical protein